MLQLLCPADFSRRDTSYAKVHQFSQMPLGTHLGSRDWVHRNLSLRVTESRWNRALVSDIVRHRHYLKRRATPPKVLALSYLATLGSEGAAAMVRVALLPSNNKPLLVALNLHACEVATLTRTWRAGDLDHTVAPRPDAFRAAPGGQTLADGLDREEVHEPAGEAASLAHPCRPCSGS